MLSSLAPKSLAVAVLRASMPSAISVSPVMEYRHKNAVENGFKNASPAVPAMRNSVIMSAAFSLCFSVCFIFIPFTVYRRFCNYESPF